MSQNPMHCEASSPVDALVLPDPSIVVRASYRRSVKDNNGEELLTNSFDQPIEVRIAEVCDAVTSLALRVSHLCGDRQAQVGLTGWRPLTSLG